MRCLPAALSWIHATAPFTVFPSPGDHSIADRGQSVRKIYRWSFLDPATARFHIKEMSFLASDPWDRRFLAFATILLLPNGKMARNIFDLRSYECVSPRLLNKYSSSSRFLFSVDRIVSFYCNSKYYWPCYIERSSLIVVEENCG